MLERVAILYKVVINQGVVGLCCFPSLVEILVLLFGEFCSLWLFDFHGEKVVLHVGVAFLHLCDDFSLVGFPEIVQVGNLSVKCQKVWAFALTVAVVKSPDTVVLDGVLGLVEELLSLYRDMGVPARRRNGGRVVASWDLPRGKRFHQIITWGLANYM